jgi:rhomboid protease GluP
MGGSMSSLRSESLAADPVFAIDPGVAHERVYAAGRAKLWGGATICLILGVAIAWSRLKEFSAWTEGTASPGPVAVAMALLAIMTIVFGVIAIVSAVRGLPRLTVSPAGVRLDYLFRTSWSDWHSLTGFAVTTMDVGRFGRRVESAGAGIVGTAVSKDLLRRKTLTIPDSFLTPIAVIVADLNARQTQILGGPPAVAGTAEDETRFGIADFKAPWLTFAILAVLVLIFAGEQIFAVDPAGQALNASIPTLLALGGLSRSVVIAGGEWYRLFTAPLLHLDIAHVALNGIALLMVGYLLERLVGRAWFFAFFVIGALGGSLASLALNPATMISVGASGAIMGLFAAALTSSFRLPAATKARSRIQIRSFQVLVPSLLPLTASARSGHVDYGAHIGGALGCAIVALVLLKTWPTAEPLPRFRKLAVGVAIAGLILIGASAAAVAIHYPGYKILAALIPESDNPKSPEEMRRRGAELVARYPQDPRSHFYLADSMFATKDYAGAERELRTSLKQAEAAPSLLAPGFASGVRFTLAAVLLEEGRADDAKDMARILCGARVDDQLRKLLENGHLCD